MVRKKEKKAEDVLEALNLKHGGKRIKKSLAAKKLKVSRPLLDRLISKNNLEEVWVQKEKIEGKNGAR